MSTRIDEQIKFLTNVKSVIDRLPSALRISEIKENEIQLESKAMGNDGLNSTILVKISDLLDEDYFISAEKQSIHITTNSGKVLRTKITKTSTFINSITPLTKSFLEELNNMWSE